MRKRLIIATAVVLPLIALGSYMLPFKSGFEELTKEQIVTKIVVESLLRNHYAAPALDDAFSKKVYKEYLQNLDRDKLFLLQADVDDLAKFDTKIDDELAESDSKFFNLSNDLFNKRLDEAQAFANEVLAQPMNLEKDEAYETNDDKRNFARNAAEMKANWQAYLKLFVVSRVTSALELQEAQEKQVKEGKKKASEVTIKTVAQLEKEAREGLAKDMKNMFDTYREMDKQERLARFLNAVTAVYDPHTSYYAPRIKERFDEDFSGKFEGIGAMLNQRDGVIKVAEIVVGSASWRQGQLKAGDVILKVAQGEAEPTDVTTMRLDNAVRLIKGKKGTEVRLTVQKPDGTISIIPIIRDVVLKEETYAKSALLQTDANGKKIGYIYLPGFYADFNGGPGGRNCAEDVKKELAKLKAEGAEGVVLDLRSNGGGSLQEVIKMMGLFIDKGPVVQVKSSHDENATVYDDRDPALQYGGPLVVMVNSYSASASEILAGAVQDYGRGVVVGGASTFGKGTVQTIIDLDRLLPTKYNEIKPLGSLFLTFQKFYRVSGGTNQLKGVVPDVNLPDNYKYLKTGEKEEDYPLAWDEISPAKFTLWPGVQPKMAAIKANSAARVAQNPTFKLIDENAQRLKADRDQTVVSLSLAKFRAEIAKDRETAKKYEAINQYTNNLLVNTLQADLAEVNLDSSRVEKNKAWHQGLKKDIYLNEALLVMKDLMNPALPVTKN
jgi:carboxyl-terminal processing protease